MATNSPTATRPTESGGIFGFLQRLFVATPAYRGDAQPQPHRGGGLLGGLFGGGTPVYRQAPPVTEPVDESATYAASAGTEEPPSCNGPSSALTIVITPD